MKCICVNVCHDKIGSSQNTGGIAVPFVDVCNLNMPIQAISGWYSAAIPCILIAKDLQDTVVLHNLGWVHFSWFWYQPMIRKPHKKDKLHPFVLSHEAFATY